MNAKEIAIKKILNDFEQVSQLCLTQLNYLKTLFGNINQDNESIYKIMRENEEIIDRFEVNISDNITNTIVLYQPLAGELRKLISCMRVLTNLERIGDLSINISEFINKIDYIEQLEYFQKPIDKMLNISISMVQDSIVAFACENEESANYTIERDDEVDNLLIYIYAKIISNKIIENNSTNAQINSLICINNICSNIERIADSATNISEAVIYMLKGKDIRHNKI